MISSISIEELINLQSNKKIIDVRSLEKYNDNHINGAIHVPFEKLILYPKKYLNYLDTYYIYCQKGTKSISLCMYLQKQGFKVVNIKGGYEEWILKN